MSKATFTVADDKKTLTAERTFSASQDKVWNALTNPKLLAKWWGPRGWETQITHMEFVNGGYWLYGMKCVDPAQVDWFGKFSWGKGTYQNIRPIVTFGYVDEFCDEHGVVTPGMPASQTTITLKESRGSTSVSSQTSYVSAEALAQVLAMGMEQGFSETWDRLEEFLVV